MSSSSDEEDDLQYWQDQRRKAKEASLSCARQNNGSIDHRHPRKPLAKHQIAVEQRKVAHKEIRGRLHEKGVHPVVNKENVHRGTEIEQKVAGRGTSTKLDKEQPSLMKTHEVLKAERKHDVKQAWVEELPVNKEEKAHQDNSIPEKKGTKKDYSPTQVKTPPSPTKTEPKTLNNKIAPSKRENLSSVDSRGKNDLVSPRNDVVKKASVKRKQVLTEEEKAKRQRLQRSLKNLKPELSSHGHHPAAPVTPVIFHEVNTI